MIGWIVNKDNELMVEYLTSYGRFKAIPIIKAPKSIKEGQTVEFQSVDEFSHPRLFANVGLFEGLESALIIEYDDNN
jgi:hypothetical protein